MSFKLNNIIIDDPVLLAPMSGVTDLPFRKLVKRYGAGIVFSEMIVSHLMLSENSDTLKMAAGEKEEYPRAVQLAGFEPEVMAKAAIMNVEMGADIIDINFGCPAKKIVNRLCGSALMREEKLAGEIMAAVVKAVDVPVTVKMRLGWDDASKNAAILSKIAEDVGIKMVTIHARTRMQMYKGIANWQEVSEIREKIKIPLIINGDIENYDDAINAMQQSGADGVMVGRGCYGKPWLLNQIAEYLKTGIKLPDPSSQEKLAIILEHYQLMLEFYGEKNGMRIARKHMSNYLKDIDDAKTHIKAVNQNDNPSEVTSYIKQLF